MKRIFALLAFLLLPVWCPAQVGGATTFFYVTTAVDANGDESIFSNEASATLKQGMAVGVTLRWTASTTPNVTYNVYRSTKTTGPYTKLNTAPVTALTFVDPFVAPVAPSGLATGVS